MQRSHLKVKALYDDDDDDDDEGYLEVYGNVGDKHGDERNGEGHAVEHWFWCVALSNTVVKYSREIQLRNNNDSAMLCLKLYLAVGNDGAAHGPFLEPVIFFSGLFSYASSSTLYPRQ